MKFYFEDTCHLDNKQIEEKGKELIEYLTHLKTVAGKKNFEDPESSINLPFDPKTLEAVKALVKKTAGEKLKYIFDIGIGGSNLGTKAVYDAKFGYFDQVNPERYPRIIFLDTNDPEFMAQVSKLLKTLSPEEFLVNVISKSGTTTEPLANLETLLPQFGNSPERIVVTSDKNSAFYKESMEKGFHVLDLPSLVGGRYSVFSSVGLFPLLAAGVDIDRLLDGARFMRDHCLNENFLENPAAVSAIILYSQFLKGKNINDNFLFHPELESVGKWYRQLMGESIGKNENVGITPTVSIGSTDLHSVTQLYLGGPKDKLTTFVSAPSQITLGIPQPMSYPTLSPHLSGKTLSQIMGAILEGTITAYKNQAISFTHIELEDLSEYSLGEFLQFKMIEMMFLGKLFGVNAFDQPHVEIYKKETKKLLTSI